jgi:hypothetical protein
MLVFICCQANESRECQKKEKKTPNQKEGAALLHKATPATNRLLIF